MAHTMQTALFAVITCYLLIQAIIAMAYQHCLSRDLHEQYTTPVGYDFAMFVTAFMMPLVPAAFVAGFLVHCGLPESNGNLYFLAAIAGQYLLATVVSSNIGRKRLSPR